MSTPLEESGEKYRERAKLFDSLAEIYDRARPGYPEELLDAVLGGSPRGLSILDVACGTGIASRALARRGAQVLGVEMNPGMAAVARRHGITVEIGKFEAWDAAGRTFDRVTCAQAWHWLDPKVSVEKAASLLRPGGRLCLIWSVGSHPDELADALKAVYRRVLPADSLKLIIGYAENRSNEPLGDFGFVVESLGACKRLAKAQVQRFPWTMTYSRDQWLDELRSHSDHAALSEELRRTLLEEVGRAIDGFGGSFRMPYTTILISAAVLD